MRSLIPVRSSLRFSLSLSLLILSLLSANAQNADEFFHGGAQRFLTNNIPGALEVVTNGLQRFPEDEKLQKLYELLNQQQQQQQNQDQKQQDQAKQDEKKQDQKQDQQKPDEKKDQQSKNDQQKKDEEKKQPDAQQKEQEKKDQQQAKSGNKDKPEEKPGEQQPVAAHAMTPEEAKQLLDAQKGDEQVLLFQPKAEPKNPSKQLKDW
jgi:outer membrane biosynthesis protein TonB